MACLNHWIPACAGMTAEAEAGICQEWQRAVGMATNPIPPLLSFQRRLESRRGGRGVNGGRFYRMPMSGCCAYVLSFPPVARMACLNHWIPACAGMTAGAEAGICQEWQRGCRDGDKPHSSPIVIPAKAGIQEGGPGSEWWQVLSDAYVRLLCLCFVIPARGGNGLSKPLDSGLRRNDKVLVVSPPSFQQSSPAWMQVVERRLEQAAGESRRAAPG